MEHALAHGAASLTPAQRQLAADSARRSREAVLAEAARAGELLGELDDAAGAAAPTVLEAQFIVQPCSVLDARAVRQKRGALTACCSRCCA